MAGGDRLAELAAELLLRGVETDKVLAILERGGGATAPEAPKKRGRGREPGVAQTPKTPRPGYVTHEQILAALSAATPGMTRPAIMVRFPSLDEQGAQRHIKRGIDLGNIMRIGDGEPPLYTVTKAGRVLAASLARRPARTPDAPEPGKRLPRLPREDFLAKLRELGPSAVTRVAAALGRSPKTVWQALDNARKDGAVKRDKDGLWSVIGARSKKPLRAQPGASVNDDRIVAALKAARTELDAQGFRAASRELKRMALPSLYMALSNSTKRGVIRRVRTGFYELAEGARQKKVVDAKANDSPAKQQSLPLENGKADPATAASAPN